MIGNFGIKQGFASLNKTLNPIKSTMKHDMGAARRAFGAGMNNLAGGGSIGSTLKTFGRDMVRDVGAKRLGMYGAGGAAGVGAAAWGLSD